MGYILAICIQSLFLVGGAAVVLVIVMAFSGFCDIFGAFCMDINQHLIELNEIVLNSHQKLTAAYRIRFATKFYGIIEFHSTVKQLSSTNVSYLRIKNLFFFSKSRFVDRFSATYSLILTTFFGISTPNICTALINLNTVLYP